MVYRSSGRDVTMYVDAERVPSNAAPGSNDYFRPSSGNSSDTSFYIGSRGNSGGNPQGVRVAPPGVPGSDSQCQRLMRACACVCVRGRPWTDLPW